MGLEFRKYCFLKLRLSKCGPRASSISVPWELLRDADSQASPPCPHPIPPDEANVLDVGSTTCVLTSRHVMLTHPSPRATVGKHPFSMDCTRLLWKTPSNRTPPPRKAVCSPVSYLRWFETPRLASLDPVLSS